MSKRNKLKPQPTMSTDGPLIMPEWNAEVSAKKAGRAFFLLHQHLQTSKKTSMEPHTGGSDDTA